MKKLVFLFLFFVHYSFGQITFQKTYGGSQDEVFYSVQQTFDGGYINVGSTNSFGAGSYDVYLVKTDSTGDTLWTKTYGGTGHDFGYCVQQTSDSGYVIIGSTDVNGTGDRVYLFKTDINGNSLWTKTYKPSFSGGSTGWSVKQTFDGGYILDCTENWDDVAFLIKTDALGDTLWTKSYGIAASPFSEVQQTADSGYIITGTGNDGGGFYYFYLVKADVNGNAVWKKAYNGNPGIAQYLAYSSQQTPEGGYIAVGYKNGTLPDVADVYIIKTNAIGDTLWTKACGGDSADAGMSIRLTADSGYIITGVTKSYGAGSFDAYLIKTDSLGNILFTKSFGGTNSEESTSVQQTLDGGYILAGSSKSFGAGANDAYLIKTDANGKSGCYENSTATIVSSPHLMISLPVDTFLLQPTVVNSYSALVSSGGMTNTLCTNVEIIEFPRDISLTIYPNPAYDDFTIVHDELNNSTFIIQNVLGQTIYSAKLESKQRRISCKEFLPGIYFVSIRSGSRLITKKLIVSK